jgi:hypothetical protein
MGQVGSSPDIDPPSGSLTVDADAAAEEVPAVPGPLQFQAETGQIGDGRQRAPRRRVVDADRGQWLGTHEEKGAGCLRVRDQPVPRSEREGGNHIGRGQDNLTRLARGLQVGDVQQLDPGPVVIPVLGREPSSPGGSAGAESQPHEAGEAADFEGRVAPDLLPEVAPFPAGPVSLSRTGIMSGQQIAGPIEVVLIDGPLCEVDVGGIHASLAGLAQGLFPFQQFVHAPPRLCLLGQRLLGDLARVRLRLLGFGHPSQSPGLFHGLP